MCAFALPATCDAISSFMLLVGHQEWHSTEKKIVSNIRRLHWELFLTQHKTCGTWQNRPVKQKLSKRLRMQSA